MHVTSNIERGGGGVAREGAMELSALVAHSLACLIFAEQGILRACVWKSKSVLMCISARL